MVRRLFYPVPPPPPAPPPPHNHHHHHVLPSAIAGSGEEVKKTVRTLDSERKYKQ